MRVAAGLISVAVISVLLAEFFVVFLLPRRVKRDPRIARGLLRGLWIPWRALAALLPRGGSDTMLGVFGPLGLLAILGMLSAGVILCFGGLQWAFASRLETAHPAGFSQEIYFSAGAFFSASTPYVPGGGAGKALQIAEAATGFGFLAIAIGYLPALFQAFSRREIAVSRLDPRAGSPPSAGALLERAGHRGGWAELDEYLREWETWAAELMETHLSYPILGYFRSQHVNQNWLAALTTIVDACSYAIAYGPEEAVEAATLTFRIGRHALADLSYAFGCVLEPNQALVAGERLTGDALSELRAALQEGGLHVVQSDEAAGRLRTLRAGYEPYALAISRKLALDLPNWLAGEVRENWRAASHPRHSDRLLP